MPYVQLTDNYLKAAGIINCLYKIEAEITKLEQSSSGAAEKKTASEEIPAAVDKPFESIRRIKLNRLKTALKSIFFHEDMSDKDVLCLLPFIFADYPSLEAALSCVFADKLLQVNISDMESSILEKIDWRPDIDTHYHHLNERYGYFSSREPQIKVLFGEVVMACRKICVLIEKNNTSDDTMAYDYAYKLMALLIDESKPLPDFNALSHQIHRLLNAMPQEKNPYHQHLKGFSLPIAAEVQNRAGWLFFIAKHGSQAITFFSKAEKIERLLEADGISLKHRAPLDLAEAKYFDAQLTYARSFEDRDWAFLCYQHHVPEFNFNAGLDYIGNPQVWPKISADFIPDVSIQHKSYIWTKLSGGDKRGLILGKMTRCCQTIGELSLVMDALSFPSNGFYVLLKSKNKTPGAFREEDGTIKEADWQIIGQSYVWLSKNGNLCLDSVECLTESIDATDLKTILYEFGMKVVEENTSIKRVTLGCGGKTPQGFFNKTKIPEVIAAGLSHDDARTQYLVARKLVPGEQALSELYEPKLPIFDECIRYLMEQLTDPSDWMTRIEAILKLSPDLPTRFNISALERLLHFSRQVTLADLAPIDFNTLEADGDVLSIGRVMWQAITPENMIKALPRLRPEDRMQLVTAALHALARDPASLKLLLPHIPAHECLAALMEKALDGNTVLHVAASIPTSLELLLPLIPQSQGLPILMQKNAVGKTVLHVALRYQASLQLLLPRLSRDERLAAMSDKNNNGDTIMHDAARSPELFEFVLTHLPDDQRLAILRQKNRLGCTVLHVASQHLTSLQLLLKCLSRDELLAAMSDKNNSGDTIMHDAAWKPELLELFLSHLPEDERLTAVKNKNDSGATAFHYAAGKLKSLKLLLSIIPKAQHAAAVREMNVDGLGALYYAVKAPESLELLLPLFTADDILLAVKGKDCFGRTALHQATDYPASLKLLLSHLPADKRLAALMEKDIYGENVLHYVSGRTELVQLILSHLPDEIVIFLDEQIKSYHLSIQSEQRPSWDEAKQTINDILQYALSIDRFMQDVADYAASECIKKFVCALINHEDIATAKQQLLASESNGLGLFQAKKIALCIAALDPYWKARIMQVPQQHLAPKSL